MNRSDNQESTTSFDEYREAREEATFAEWLRTQSEPAWTKAVEHPFTTELANNTLNEDIFQTYLLEDLDFVETLISVFGYAVGQARSTDTQKRLIDFLATITSDENDYFERSFRALGVSETTRQSHEINDTNRNFQSLLLSTAREDVFAHTLSVLLPVEWVYEAWASRVSDRSPSSFYFREWIELHDNPSFHTFVDHMRSRINELGPNCDPREQVTLQQNFAEVVQYETAFFDAVYDG